MKKFILVAVLSALLVCIATGCVDKVDMQGTAIRAIDIREDESWQMVETVASTIEGYRLVAGSLEELDIHSFAMKTTEGHELVFKIAPETIVYTGSEEALVPGDDITVVFEGELEGTDTDHVSVIAVSGSVEEGRNTIIK